MLDGRLGETFGKERLVRGQKVLIPTIAVSLNVDAICRSC
jgi:hypothetical protein